MILGRKFFVPRACSKRFLYFLGGESVARGTDWFALIFKFRFL